MDREKASWGLLQTIAQAVVFLVVLGLLGVELFWPAERPGIDWPVTFGLLVVALIVIVLPRLTSFRFEGFGVRAQVAMEAAQAATQKMAEAVGAEGVEKVLQASPSTSEAASDPLVSLEHSRRKLAAEVALLAESAHVSLSGRLDSTADDLRKAGVLDNATADAIGKVAEAIEAGKKSRDPAPGLALEVDYATQLIVGQLGAARDRLVSLVPPTPPPGTPAGWLDDPNGKFQHRYWDGVKWTEHVSSNGERTSAPL